MAATIETLGDSAWILRELPAEPYRFVAALSSVAKVVEAASSYESVAVFFDPLDPPDRAAVLSVFESPLTALPESRLHSIPVCYELGEDLASVAETLGMTAEGVITAHCGEIYTCWAVGFRPGFPYLGWLPDRLQGVRRLPQPRVRVPRGSVAIAGRQTGIYPEESPGGWSILGRTPLTIVDVESDYFPIAAGDRVRFERIDLARFKEIEGERL